MAAMVAYAKAEANAILSANLVIAQTLIDTLENAGVLSGEQVDMIIAGAIARQTASGGRAVIRFCRLVPRSKKYLHRDVGRGHPDAGPPTGRTSNLAVRWRVVWSKLLIGRCVCRWLIYPAGTKKPGM
jgi:hypothetical protein